MAFLRGFSLNPVAEAITHGTPWRGPLLILVGYGEGDKYKDVSAEFLAILLLDLLGFYRYRSQIKRVI
jgi:hypothetical protein